MRDGAIHTQARKKRCKEVGEMAGQLLESCVGCMPRSEKGKVSESADVKTLLLASRRRDCEARESILRFDLRWDPCTKSAGRRLPPPISYFR